MKLAFLAVFLVLSVQAATVAQPQGESCVLCEWIITEAEQYISQNSSVAEIEQILDNVCADFPSTVSSLCQSFVNAYAPQIIALLINDASPDQVCTAIGVCTSTLSDSAPVLNDALIARINAAKKGWKAGRNSRFEGVTVGQAKRLLGTRISHTHTRPAVRVPGAVPDSFDSRTKWPTCVHPVRNQEQCGSCWAFGASESFSDRLCVKNSSINVVLSPQWIVSCDTTDYGCQGGYLQNAWQFMASTGVVLNSCDPYTSGSGSVAPCPSTCATGGPLSPNYKVDASTIQTLTSEAPIQQALMADGPVEAAFSVYQDFFSYTSGVYVWDNTSPLMGGHAIKIVGWGVTNDEKKQEYWIVYNSWGTSWGMDGLFWILRGVNECGIESNVVVGLPAGNF